MLETLSNNFTDCYVISSSGSGTVTAVTYGAVNVTGYKTISSRWTYKGESKILLSCSRLTSSTAKLHGILILYTLISFNSFVPSQFFTNAILLCRSFVCKKKTNYPARLFGFSRPASVGNFLYLSTSLKAPVVSNLSRTCKSRCVSVLCHPPYLQLL